LYYQKESTVGICMLIVRVVEQAVGPASRKIVRVVAYFPKVRLPRQLIGTE